MSTSRFFGISHRIARRPLALAVAAGLAASPVMGQEAIDLLSLDGDSGFVINGIDVNDRSGQSVSAAGDVNGDGIDDVIIGASFADPGTNREGESYVVFGSDQGFAASLDLSSLTGSNGFVLNGVDANDYSGYSVSAAGDVNGDGIDDVIIGAHRADPGTNDEGESYVVFGSDQRFAASLDLSSLDGSNGFVLNGIDANDRSGDTVSAAGDVNGDGIDDVIIGADRADPGTNNEGESYVVFGSDQGFAASLDLSSLNGSNGFALNGVDVFDYSGVSVSGAGDVNGDGMDDVIIGAFTADPGIDSEGESYVVFGFDNPSISTLNLGGLNGANGFVLNGIDAFDRSGYSVSGAGDVNGDGINDVIIGAPLASSGSSLDGESYVVFGSDQGFAASLDLSSLNGSNGFVLNGIDADDRSGFSVSAAGDVNGDGIDDVIIGAAFANPGTDDEGESYVVFGSDRGFAASLDLSSLNGSNGFVLNGIDASDRSGRAVSGAGDVNGDGIDDVIIGANLADPGVSGEGESYVVFGNAAPLALGSQALLSGQLEDDAGAAGSRLDFTAAAHYLDVDPFGGLAVVNDNSTGTQGSWQYSTNAVDWTPVPDGLSDSNALVLNATSLLRFVPATDFAGQPGPLNVRLWDGRWRVPGEGVDIANAVGALGGFANDNNLLDVTVNIEPVNDAPSFTATSPPAVDEDPGGVTVANWSSFDPGASNEADQFALTYQVENISDPGLFSFPPTIGTLGNLVYDTKLDVSGTSTFDVRVVDSGGMENGGINVSGFQTFTITVNPVNDPPAFTADDPPKVLIDAGAQTVSNWAAFDPGAFNERAQSPTYQVTGVADPGLFSAAPAVDSLGNLTYTPAAGMTGTTTFTVQVQDDGGTANGGVDTSSPQQFTVQIRSSDIFSDSFEN